jgi:hypothetical protein
LTDGRIALHIAACKGQAAVVRLLLDSKANMNARDRWGSIVRGLIYHYFIHVLSAPSVSGTRLLFTTLL